MGSVPLTSITSPPGSSCAPTGTDARTGCPKIWRSNGDRIFYSLEIRFPTCLKANILPAEPSGLYFCSHCQPLNLGDVIRNPFPWFGVIQTLESLSASKPWSNPFPGLHSHTVYHLRSTVMGIGLSPHILISRVVTAHMC